MKLSLMIRVEEEGKLPQILLMDQIQGIQINEPEVVKSLLSEIRQLVSRMVVPADET